MKTARSTWFVRREVPLPTGRTCLVFLLLAGVAVILAGRSAYSFLAIDDSARVGNTDYDLLCLEGWAHEGVVAEVARNFHTGRFQRIAVTGGPVQGRERWLGFDTYAEWGARRLIDSGIPEEHILVSAPGKAETRRTLRDIVELQATLEARNELPRRLLVISGGVHTRRTCLLYRKVFGRDVEVRGVAVAPEGYDPEAWWQSSEGVKTVIMELISLAYDGVIPMEPSVVRS